MPPALGNVRRGAGASKATFCQDIEHKFNLEDNNFKQLHHQGMGSPRLPSTATRSSWQEGGLLETQHPSHVVCLRFPKITVSSCTPGYIATDLTKDFLVKQGKTAKEAGMKTPAEVIPGQSMAICVKCCSFVVEHNKSKYLHRELAAQSS